MRSPWSATNLRGQPALYCFLQRRKFRLEWGWPSVTQWGNVIRVRTEPDVRTCASVSPARSHRGGESWRLGCDPLPTFVFMPGRQEGPQAGQGERLQSEEARMICWRAPPQKKRPMAAQYGRIRFSEASLALPDLQTQSISPCSSPHSLLAFLKILLSCMLLTRPFCIPFPCHLFSPAETPCIFLSPVQMPQSP